MNSVHIQGPDFEEVFSTGEDLECSELLARALKLTTPGCRMWDTQIEHEGKCSVEWHPYTQIGDEGNYLMEWHPHTEKKYRRGALKPTRKGL